MCTPTLANPDPTNPRDLTRSALNAIRLANCWAAKPGKFAARLTRTYVRRASLYLRLANALCAKRAKVSP